MRESVRRDLAPGDRLAPESTMTSIFEVSRGSLREALRVLSYLGAVEVRTGPGGGGRLTRPGARVVGSALAMALQFRGATLATLLEARSAVQPALAALAAERRSELDVAALDGCVARAHAATSDDVMLAERKRFRRIASDAGGNAALTVIGQALSWMIGAIVPERVAGAPAGIAARMGEIADAIRRQDSDAARTLTAASLAAEFEAHVQHNPQLLGRRVIWSDVDELPDPEERAGLELP